MDDRVKMQHVLYKLRERYPESECALEFRSPLELMVSTQLSAQCTDKRVNIITKELFKKYRTVDDYADADITQLEEAIRPAGFFRNKAKNIINMARKLRDEYGYKFPDTLDELMKLDGVGRKTGNLFIGEVYGKPGIVVDTHVRRISKRLGFTGSDDPDKIEKELENITAEEDRIALGHLVISFGRDICDARKPACERCFFTDICSYFNERKKASL